MIYRVQVNRKIRNIKVYNILKKGGQKENVITRLFERVFVKRKPDEEKG